MFHSFFFYRESCCCFWSKRDSSFLLACKSARVEAKQGARALLLLCLLYRDRVSNMKWPNAWYVRQWNLVIVLYFRFLKSKGKNSGKGTLKRMKFFVTKTRLYCIIIYIFFFWLPYKIMWHIFWKVSLISGVSETSPLHQYNLDVGEDDVFMVSDPKLLFFCYCKFLFNFSNSIFRWTNPTQNLYQEVLPRLQKEEGSAQVDPRRHPVVVSQDQRDNITIICMDTCLSRSPSPPARHTTRPRPPQGTCSPLLRTSRAED